MERKSAGLRARRMTEADLEPLHRLLSDRARRQGRGVVIECVPEQTVTRHIAEKSGFTVSKVKSMLFRIRKRLYAQLTEELGAETMKKTVDQLGLTKSLSVAA